MVQPQKEPLRAMSEQEEREVQRLVKASSERLDVVRRAKALLAVRAGQPFTEAAHEAGLKSGKGVGKLVKRFNAHGLAALSIAAGAGRKPTYTREQQARILQEVPRTATRAEDGTASWSLTTMQRALRKTDLADIARETIRQVLHEAGYSFQQTRTWCRTGYALRKRKSGTVTNAVLHPWLKKEELLAMLATIEKAHPREELLPEAKRPRYAEWTTYLPPSENAAGLAPLRIILVMDNLAGHLTPTLVVWLFHHGIMPLYTPVGSSWLNMAESAQGIIVPRALAGQHPHNAQEVIDWLEQTVAGWNQKPTPLV